MRLYLIKRRSDKKFFVAIHGHWALNTKYHPEVWSDKPQTFFRTPEGIAGNLRKLCSTPYWDREAPPGVCAAVAEGWKEIAWRDFDAEKLNQFEVVAMDIDILSMSATPASEFVQTEAIATRPLTKRERMQGVAA